MIHEYKSGILRGLKFSFDEFFTAVKGMDTSEYGEQRDSALDEYDLMIKESSEKMKTAVEDLIIQLGGEIVLPTRKLAANVWLYYNKFKNSQNTNASFCPPTIKKLHFTFVTECFFAMGQCDMAAYQLN